MRVLHEKLLLLLCVIAVRVVTTRASNTSRFEGRKILNELLAEETYDKDVPPRDNGTEVKVNMYVRDMDIVDKARGELHLQVDLRQRWNDPRLAYNRSHPGVPKLKTQDVTRFWTPGLYVVNQIKRCARDLEILLVEILPNGDVVLTQRSSVKVVSYMDVKWFPFDFRNCSVKLSSSLYSNETVRLEWDTDPVKLDEAVRPSVVGNYEFLHFNITKCNVTGVSAETHSCIGAAFIFDRRGDDYMTRTSPTYFIISANTLASWFHGSKISLRLTINLSALVLLVVHLSLGGGDVRFTGGISTAWDLFCWVSLYFVACQLGETLSRYMKYRRDRKMCKTSSTPISGLIFFRSLFVIYALVYRYGFSPFLRWYLPLA